MGDVLPVVLALAYGYLVGSVPTAYIMARLVRGVDIRRYGSGNVGASNVARHIGKAYFVPVAAFDVLVKGTSSVWLAQALGLDIKYQGLTALLAIAGHNWSIYLRFSGGRGLSVVGGSLLILAWKELLASLGVALVGWLLFRSTALWFGIALVLLPVWAIAFREPAAIVVFCIALVLVTALKRLVANPGTTPPGRRWRDVVLYRLLYDRDTTANGNWIRRRPEDKGSERET